MTTVQVWRDEHGVTGLKVKGHAGYAEEGSDIVCAAASILITTCANALETVVGIKPLVVANEQNTSIMVALPKGLSPEKDHDARIVLHTTLQGFTDLTAEYHRYLQII